MKNELFVLIDSGLFLSPCPHCDEETTFDRPFIKEIFVDKSSAIDAKSKLDDGEIAKIDIEFDVSVGLDVFCCFTFAHPEHSFECEHCDEEIDEQEFFEYPDAIFLSESDALDFINRQRNSYDLCVKKFTLI